MKEARKIWMKKNAKYAIQTPVEGIPLVMISCPAAITCSCKDAMDVGMSKLPPLVSKQYLSGPQFTNNVKHDLNQL
jgi:hypothetical protein